MARWVLARLVWFAGLCRMLPISVLRVPPYRRMTVILVRFLVTTSMCTTWLNQLKMSQLNRFIMRVELSHCIWMREPLGELTPLIGNLLIKQMKQVLRNPSMTLAGLMRFLILRKPSMRSAVTLLTITRTTVLMCLPARLLLLRIVARLRWKSTTRFWNYALNGKKKSVWWWPCRIRIPRNGSTCAEVARIRRRWSGSSKMMTIHWRLPLSLICGLRALTYQVCRLCTFSNRWRVITSCRPLPEWIVFAKARKAVW